MKKKSVNQKVHKELKDFDIKVNPFGELKSSMNIDDINEFLNKHVPDKRIIDNESSGIEEE
ncbi:MAG: hypothetical protein ABI844_00450 [Saprospiraceae bacterium]